MALPLGKLGLLIGAGIVGSYLVKEGHTPSVSDLFSGAFKVFKKINQGDSSPSSVKPRNDALLAQVSSLREELQILASNRSVTIITTNGTGASKYGIVVVVVVVGYGYIWWKGWKLPDLMFATKRGLSDACTTIAKQLEDVYSSLSATRRALSSKIEKVNSKLDECATLGASTSEEVSVIQGRTSNMGKSIRSVRETVESLETKIVRIGGRQDITNEGVRRLCDYALSLDNSRTTELIQVTPSGASRRPQITPSSRTGSMPSSVLPLEAPSPTSSIGPHQESQGISEAVETSTAIDASQVTPTSDETSNGPSSSVFSRHFFRRTFSATQGMISRIQS